MSGQTDKSHFAIHMLTKLPEKVGAETQETKRK